MGFCRRFVPVVVLASLSSPALCAEDGGGLVGWVESTRGAPVAGAVISVFGKGISGGSLMTLADSDGQFILPSLPAGSYTLRALGTGHLPSAAERVTVLPDRDSLFTLSLTPVGEAAAKTPATEEDDETGEVDLSEWHWLMRHKRRSVLETAEHDVALPEDTDMRRLAASSQPQFRLVDPLEGRVELMALSNRADAPDYEPGQLPTGMGTLQLQGRLADGVLWSVGGLLAESGGRTWRTAAEFVLEPGGGHEIQTGAGYGAGYLRALLPASSPEGDRPVGAFFIKDRWRVGEKFTTTLGTRYTYIGFLSDAHHADAIVEVELRGDAATLVRGSMATRTLAPGGDLLTLSSVSASPAITWAHLSEGLRPSRSLRFEVGVDHSFRSGGHVGAFAFREQTRDQLWTTFENGSALRVRNAGTVGVQGLGFTVRRGFGSAFTGSVTYSFGRGSRRGGPAFGARVAALRFTEAEFHDLVARLETFIGWTDTRVAALYRVNALSEETERASRPFEGSATTTRFDVQVTQGLPFLQPLTRADWNLLVAVSNLFYEASEGGLLDELAVEEPPTRVVGGFSVRF
ncbi:MAG: TonB-dependent receptor [Acidobacteriota bacterium]